MTITTIIGISIIMTILNITLVFPIITNRTNDYLARNICAHVTSYPSPGQCATKTKCIDTAVPFAECTTAFAECITASVECIIASGICHAQANRLSHFLISLNSFGFSTRSPSKNHPK